MSSRRSHGFTLVEVLVAMIAGSIVVHVAYMLFLLAANLFQQWQHRLEVAGELNAVCLILERSMEKISKIDLGARTTLEGTDVGGRPISIRLTDRVWLNGQAVTDSGAIDSGSGFTYRLSGPEGPGGDVSELDRFNHSRVTAVRLMLKLVRQGYVLDAEIAVELWYRGRVFIEAELPGQPHQGW